MTPYEKYVCKYLWKYKKIYDNNWKYTMFQKPGMRVRIRSFMDGLWDGNEKAAWRCEWNESRVHKLHAIGKEHHEPCPAGHIFCCIGLDVKRFGSIAMFLESRPEFARRTEHIQAMQIPHASPCFTKGVEHTPMIFGMKPLRFIHTGSNVPVALGSTTRSNLNVLL